MGRRIRKGTLSVWGVGLALLFGWFGVPPVARAQADVSQAVSIEYVAHAAVVISAGGTRVLIDPYNGSRWMGYGFPDDLDDVDAVLITHPHYDHDGRYYADAGVPVFTEPGHFRFGALEFIGVDSEHVGGARFRDNGMSAYNVIWTVVSDGLRLTHVGDNRPLTVEDLAAVERTDVLFVPPFHAVAQARSEAQALGARIVVPIHYALPELRAERFRMPDVDQWLDGAVAVRDDDNRMSVSSADLPEALEIRVFQPHPGVSRWREELQQAWGLYFEATSLRGEDDLEGAVSLLTEAAPLGPEVMLISLTLGEVLLELGRPEEAEVAWETALVLSVEGDTEPTLRIRGALAKRYVESGRLQEAELLYRAIARAGRTWAEDIVEEADTFLRGR